MTDPFPPRISLEISGARGESILDVTRRLGLGGAPSDASDTEAAAYLALYTENQLASPPIYNSSTSFKIIGADLTRFYAVGKYVRVSGTATGTIYGIINTSAFTGGNTIVTVTWASGSLSNEAISVSIVPGPAGTPVNAKDAAYGAVGSGAVDDGPAIQLALTAAAGNTLLLPKGTFKITTPTTIPANTIIQGMGDGTIIDADCHDYFSATSAAGIVFRDMKIKQHSNAGNRLTLTLCDRAKFINVHFDGTQSGASVLTAQQVWLKGCADALFFGCRFEDANNAIYLDKSGATYSSRVKVLCCNFEHAAHGNFFQNPAQIYQLYCNDLIVDDCTFKDIFPGDTSASQPGYCVYEGDGESFSTIVSNCRYLTTEARTDTVFCLTSTSQDILLHHNNAVADDAAGGGYLYRGSAAGKALHIDNNIGRGFGILAAEDGISEAITITNNDIIANVGLFSAIRVGAGSATAVHVDIRGNTIRNSTYGGISVFAGTWFDVADNQLLDCNLSDTARSGGNEHKSSCIVISGQSGRIARNRMRNSASGHAKYGIDLVDAVNTTRVEPDNSFVGMETGDVLNNVYLAGSTTYNPASLGDGVGATTTVTVSGAVLGDFAEASFSLDLQGITLTAWVSAADTVSVRFQNESTGTIDLASGTLRARVTKKM